MIFDTSACRGVESGFYGGIGHSDGLPYVHGSYGGQIWSVQGNVNTSSDNVFSGKINICPHGPTGPVISMGCSVSHGRTSVFGKIDIPF